VLAVVAELLAEVGGQDFVFDLDADFGADEEEDDGRQEQSGWCDDNAGAEQNSEHGCVDGMADDGVRAGADELVVGGDGGVEAEMSAKGIRRCPREQRGDCKEDRAGNRAPESGRRAREMAQP